jgi:hypothetical protein
MERPGGACPDTVWTSELEPQCGAPKARRPQLRRWYASKSVDHGWPVAVLEHQIITKLHGRTGAEPNNLEKRLRGKEFRKLGIQENAQALQRVITREPISLRLVSVGFQPLTGHRTGSHHRRFTGVTARHTRDTAEHPIGRIPGALTRSEPATRTWQHCFWDSSPAAPTG